MERLPKGIGVDYEAEGDALHQALGAWRIKLADRHRLPYEDLIALRTRHNLFVSYPALFNRS